MKKIGLLIITSFISLGAIGHYLMANSKAAFKAEDEIASITFDRTTNLLDVTKNNLMTYAKKKSFTTSDGGTVSAGTTSDTYSQFFNLASGGSYWLSGTGYCDYSHVNFYCKGLVSVKVDLSYTTQKANEKYSLTYGSVSLYSNSNNSTTNQTFTINEKFDVENSSDTLVFYTGGSQFTIRSITLYYNVGLCRDYK